MFAMDRISLGISVQFNRVDFCLLNLENLRIVQDLSVAYQPSSVLSLLNSIDEIFFLLSRNRYLGQVVMLKVASSIDWFVCLQEDFLFRMLKFNAYAESLKAFFADLLRSESILFLGQTISESNCDGYQKSGAKSLPLASFLTTVLAGKNAPMDSELETCFGDFLKKEKAFDMIGFHASSQAFSYASSYFVEKYKLPREAQILPAGDRFSLCAFSARYPVYCEFDVLLLGGVLVNQPDSNEQNSFSINSKQSLKKSFGLEAKTYEKALKQMASKSGFVKVCDKFEDFSRVDFSKDLSTQHFDEVDLFVNQLSMIENDLRRDSVVHLMGVGQNSKYFSQLLSNVLNEQVGYHQYSRISGALGASLYAGRRFLEEDLVEMQNKFFNNYPFSFLYPNEEQSLVYSELLKIR